MRAECNRAPVWSTRRPAAWEGDDPRIAGGARFTDDAHRPCSRCGVGRSRISLRGIPVHLAARAGGRTLLRPPRRRAESLRPRGGVVLRRAGGARGARANPRCARAPHSDDRSRSPGRRRVLLERVGCLRTEGRARSVLRVARESGQRHAGRLSDRLPLSLGPRARPAGAGYGDGGRATTGETTARRTKRPATIEVAGLGAPWMP